MSSRIIVSALLITLAGCVSKSKYEEVVQQQQQLIEQKDSLVADVLATSQMITEINTDLAQVKSLGMSPTTSGDRPLTGKSEERAIMLSKVRDVLARLATAEAQVDSQKKRLGSLGAERSRLLTQLTSFQQTIAEMRTAAELQEALISDQKEQIRTLTARVDTFTTRMQDLAVRSEQLAAATAAEKAALRDTIAQVSDEANTAYYIVGTRDELLKSGVVVNEGKKFLVFGGRTLQPARNPDPALFKRLDIRRDTVLTVPDSNTTYTIVTRQSPRFLASTVLPDGKVKGDLHLSSPEFWEGGRYLILVRN